MQSLNNDERKGVLGEVLGDLEYVKDVPSIQQELHQVPTVHDISDRLSVIEHVVRKN